MFKLLKNKRGQTGLEIPVMVYVVASIMAVITSVGLVKTGLDGTLVNNSKVIACKAANKGEEYCNAKYNYVPKTKVEVVKKGGGLRSRILAAQ